MGSPGNVFVTAAVPMAAIPIPLTLTPLRVGVIVAQAVQATLPTAGSAARLKWPNDVLIGSQKCSGVLIEGDGEHLFIGVGVNLRSAPPVPTEGPQKGRPSTCLADHGAEHHPAAVQALAVAIAQGIAAWAEKGSDSAAAVHAEWTSLAEWDVALSLRDSKKPVTPLRLEADGQLTVRGLDGREFQLVAEYLF